MNRVLLLTCIFGFSFFAPILYINNEIKPHVDVNIVEVSQSLLLAAKTKNPVDDQLNLLKELPESEFMRQLANDDLKKAFWINIYNAYTQILLSKNPDQYANRNAFFSANKIVLAGHNFSLDEIEHGILRHSKNKLSLGYLNKIFTSSLERKLRVQKLDYRIHFALNCGAKSCPPIAFYKPDQINKQLDMATSVYLKGDCNYHENGNYVEVPALMNWFRADFGGKKGVLQILKKLSIVPNDQSPSIRFKKYNWTLYLENFKNE